MSSWQVFLSSARAEGPEERQEHVRPAWLGPPEGELGRAVDLGLVIGRSEHGVVAVSHALAYSNGISFELLAHARGLKRNASNRLFHEQHLGFGEPDEELPDGFLRLGIELPGGARVSNLEPRHLHYAREHEPDRPFLVQHGGSGGQAGADTAELKPGYWLWPLPEEGTLRFSCEWPIVGLPFSTVEVDAGPLRAAGLAVRKLWGDDD